MTDLLQVMQQEDVMRFLINGVSVASVTLLTVFGTVNAIDFILKKRNNKSI